MGDKEAKLGTATDEQLMLAFKTGDARAFATLVSRHRGAVYNFILRYTGHPARSEDLLQETWLKVVRSSSEYQPKARFTTWVFTIARNLCVDSARKESYRKADSLDAARSDAGSSGSSGHGQGEGPTLSETIADTNSGPDRAAHNLRMRPIINRALEALPDEQREVFLLREYHGVSFKEIADVTGVNENTVKSRMRYALEGLRKRLSELGVEAELLEGRTVA